MNSAVCTLFEGDYYYGVGALVNSLYKHGFRGVIWAGYRGALPPWVKNIQQYTHYQEFEVAEGCCIRFIAVSTRAHLTNYKPAFMLDLWGNYCPDADELFYFDPDIVVKCRWSFFMEWAYRGVALCQEVSNQYWPVDHPIRLMLRDFAEANGFTCYRSSSQYFNGGFIGVHKKFRSFLELWVELIQKAQDEGGNVQEFNLGDITKLFNSLDQDTLYLASTISEYPLSTLGSEGMDFVSGGFTMSHAVGSAKPWRKHMLREAVVGNAPTSADKGYWQHTKVPISLYSASMRIFKIVDLRCGAGLGRFVGRR